VIEDYGMIGDGETAALVSREGSIDWLCWPRFDSGACFAALLGTPQHGRWLITTAGRAVTRTRRYRRHTLILETLIEQADGAVTVIDFMPPRSGHSDIVRLVRGERGRVTMRLELVLRFDYGQRIPWVNHSPDGRWQAVGGPDRVTLDTPILTRGRDLTTIAEFEVTAGSTIPFVLTYSPSHTAAPGPIDPESALTHTEDYWTAWTAQSGAVEGWSDPVLRSLITLKALIYAPTGGIVAAPTSSLPEWVGGVRNWDYRFCWIRDATLTLLALLNAGYVEEARAWRDWLLRAAAGAPAQLQIMYGLSGERRLAESELAWLPGYMGSRPVRIGNAAHSQFQLDVYGEVMDALHQARRSGLESREADWAFQRALLVHLESVWQEPDHGLWEIRGPARHFTYSKVMAWVAFDRGIRAITDAGLEGPIDRWRSVRDDIHREVCARAFDPKLGSFVQAYGTTNLDASLLLVPTTGFLPPTDPRILGTIDAVERGLFVDGFLRRYDTHTHDDGLPPGEGVFLACSFWLADAYTLVGRVDEARRLFDRLLALRNDVGLFSEEYDPETGRLLGNFPQAFSHVALVNTAHNIERATKPAEQRAST
jgi:GH15 family glucan-1,4-alpha-glucosidase